MNIFEMFSTLKERSVCDIGAAADMLWIDIDNKYAIDIQTQFRIIKGKNIVLSNAELFNDLDVVRENIIKCKFLLGLPCSIYDIYCDRCNDLHIFLSNGCVIETFTNTTDVEDEHWRIFERHNSSQKHYVAYPNEICEE